jgi:hypothetical protein
MILPIVTSLTRSLYFKANIPSMVAVLLIGTQKMTRYVNHKIRMYS